MLVVEETCGRLDGLELLHALDLTPQNPRMQARHQQDDDFTFSGSGIKVLLILSNDLSWPKNSFGFDR